MKSRHGFTRIKQWDWVKGVLDLMKNVAGYDVSKLLVGSMGRLALVTQISLKILPEKIAEQYQLKPPPKQKVSEISLNFESKLKKVFDPYGVFI